ncbi:MAG: hypothetical protein IJQ21_04915 [Lachnospiraceae bacterium]|nr:hypothetical protein [Lachnospiraceae bacterium]
MKHLRYIDKVVETESDAIQPDEEEAHRIAQEERVRGEVFSDAEVWA